MAGGGAHGSGGRGLRVAGFDPFAEALSDVAGLRETRPGAWGRSVAQESTRLVRTRDGVFQCRVRVVAIGLCGLAEQPGMVGLDGSGLAGLLAAECLGPWFGGC